MHSSRLLAALTAVGLLSPAHAEDLAKPALALPLMTAAPVIDGEIGAEEWGGAARMERFCRRGSPSLHGGNGGFWVGCDGRNLFVAVTSETPPGGRLLSRVNPRPGETDAPTHFDDTVEVTIAPPANERRGPRQTYFASFNAKQAIRDHVLLPGGKRAPWRGKWKTGSQVNGDRWSFELAIGLAELGLEAGDLAKPMGILVTRTWRRTVEAENWSGWCPVEDFGSPRLLPQVVWIASAPVVQVTQLAGQAAGQLDARVTIRNPGAKEIGVKAAVTCRTRSLGEKRIDDRFAIPPGTAKEIALQGRVGADEEVATRINVTSTDESTVFYRREFRWRPTRPEPFFTLEQRDSRRAAVSFAYYPYHDTIKVVADLTGMQSRERVRAIQLELRQKGGKAIAHTQMPEMRDYRSLIEWRVPPLSRLREAADGRYGLVVSFDGVHTDHLSYEFSRHVFPWERNSLGQSNAIIPPFTPIAVEGLAVKTVLRSHAVGELGLWDQVASKDADLLSGPMRLEVRAGGRTEPVTVRRFSFEEVKPHRAVSASTWASESLRGTTRSVWDYDGMMLWTLKLEPTDREVESVRLVIPVRDDRAPLMHACADFIRSNYGGAVPKGEGRVWDGARATRRGIIGSYVPYLWVGAEERGLCVFGDNDRGWVTDEKVPCQELVRRGDTLALLLNLIARPTAIAQARTIRIGFQATPVKPRPRDWRRWRAWPSYRGHAGNWSRSIGFVGSGWSWGTLTAAADLYPRNRDFSIYDKFAETRRTGKIDFAFIETWVAGYPGAGATDAPSAAMTEKRRTHVTSGFRTMSGRPERVMFYTNARGARLGTPEGQTFLDEWHRDAFVTRKWGHQGGTWYDVNPGESFRDYALWHYEKMIASGACDSIYWDNVFPQACFDTVGTEAYHRPDGRIQPSVGILDVRELIRRTAIFLHESGREPLNMVHMTNTAIAPICAFAQMNYSWEDKKGDADYQDRWRPDYIRAVSTGLQHGNLGVVLDLTEGKNPDQLQWARRTLAGVTIVHEIRTTTADLVFWKTMDLLFDYGYGRPEVEVSQYWRADHPAQVEGAEALTLVLRKPGSVLVFVCDYSPREARGPGDRGNVGPAAELPSPGQSGTRKKQRKALLLLDRKALDLEGAIRAVDLEAEYRAEDAPGEEILDLQMETEIGVTPRGEIAFPLGVHDFRIVLIRRAE